MFDQVLVDHDRVAHALGYRVREAGRYFGVGNRPLEKTPRWREPAAGGVLQVARFLQPCRERMRRGLGTQAHQLADPGV